MALDIKPLHPLFVAEIGGVDFSNPVDPDTLRGIVAALDRYAVCVFRGTGLDDEIATRPQFRYRLRWHGPGDLVIWDNRCTMHRATPFDDTKYRRDMRRTTVLESRT